MKRIITILCVALTVTGCARSISPDTYSVGSVGNANRTIRGEIINVREVRIEGSRSGLGAGSGAAGGAVAGSALGGGVRSVRCQGILDTGCKNIRCASGLLV